MANEKDPAAPPAPAAPPVEGATRQFSLKMSGWLNALGVDLEAEPGAPTPAAPSDLELDLLGPPGGAQAQGGAGAEELSLERALFPSDPPPKP